MISLSLSYKPPFSGALLYSSNSLCAQPFKRLVQIMLYFPFVSLFWKAEKDSHEKGNGGRCSRVPELLCKLSFSVSLHLQSKSSEWVSAFGHQLEALLVMSTVGSKILLPRTEEGTSVAVGTVSIEPFNSPVEICGSMCVSALSLSNKILLMCLGLGNNRQHQWMLFHFYFFFKVHVF